jgi:dCTP deaminase
VQAARSIAISTRPGGRAQEVAILRVAANLSGRVRERNSGRAVQAHSNRHVRCRDHAQGGEMVLSDRSIRGLIESGRLRIDPFDPSAIQPSSIDLRLENRFRVFATTRHAYIDPRIDQPDLTHLVTVPGDHPFVLQPGQFCLGNTYEELQLPDDVVGRLEGKSSLGRLGLVIHSTAGYVDPGFRGRLTLELSNAAGLPILLYPGMKIGQLSLLQMTTAAERPYGTGELGSKYQGQDEPTASRSHLDFRTGS